MTTEIAVRDVRKEDLSSLALVEQERWEREHTDIISLETLEEWYKTSSPFFLVAEKDGRILGYYYGIQVCFSMDNIDEFTSALKQTDLGYTAHAHDPTGNCMYAVTVVVIASEVGVLLNAEMHKRMKQKQMVYFTGVSRLAQLDRYLRGIENTCGGTLPYAEEEIVLWYTHQSMKLIGNQRIWDKCTAQPDLDLPPLRRPDAVLRFHVEAIHAGLLRIIPNYMEDPKSRGYGAFLASKLT